MDYRGTERADVLTGGADNDVIYGFGGNDTLKGGAGDDVLAGNDGNDILSGGDGDDYILGGAGNDTIDGGAGNDWAAYEDATAGVKVDLNITVAQNTIGSGTDKLTGIENVYGSDFNDTLIGDANDNMMVGGAGNDTVSGGKGNDTLWGSAGNDTLDGGDGDDYLVGGAGDDIVKGGAGVDWASYEDATAGVTVDLNKTTQQDTIGAGKDTLSGIELLYGSKFDDVLTGDAKDNYLWGSDGNDKLYGGAGDDHLSGGNGVNIIDGGDGFDTVDYAFSDHGVSINLSGGPAPQIPIPDGVDTIISVEAAMGSAYNDYIVGNDAENYLFGDAGDDVIFGIGGNDTLDGGDGNDILRGSFRRPGDLLLGGAGNDTAIVWIGPGSEGLTTADGGTGVDLLSFAAVYDITFDLRNTGDQLIAPGVHIVAQNFENVTGGAGNDRLTGDAGANVLNGGAGNDVLDGGAGFDIASYEGGDGVRVDLSKAGVAQDTHGAGMDTLINIEGLRGSSLGDILIGDAKDNSLEGSSGNDILDGGAGVDTAIFWGNSTDYTWTKNTNGTWTVKGLDGVDTLLNVEILKFNDKSVTLPSSATTVTVDDLVGPKTLVTSAAGDLRDVVLSQDGATAYVSSKDGYVSAIDTTTGQVKAHLKVGTDLGGMDLSLDGRYLVVAERAIENEQASPGSAWSGTVTVHVVDLTTGVVKNYTTTASDMDRGFADAAFTSDGKIFLSQDFAGSGRTPVTILDPVTGAFTTTTNEYSQSGYISVSGDHKTVLLAPANISDAPLVILNKDGLQTAIHDGYADGVIGYNRGFQAISNDGKLVAQWTGGVSLYDSSLKYLGDVAATTKELSDVYGIDFSPDGKHLFVVDGTSDKIFEFSTTTGILEHVFSAGANLAPENSVLQTYMFGDRVSISNDGNHMLIGSGYGVISVSLNALVAEAGTGGADTLTGTNAADTLYGYGGADTLIGGKGADILYGGKGADTFVFAKGDTVWTAGDDSGIDTIRDWDLDDQLSFGPSTSTGYGEKTAASWAEAVAMAPQVMAAENLSHLAVQVGNDTYVFHGTPGATTTEIDNVVKLANTGLDKVYDGRMQLTLNGDGAANTLIGQNGNDIINGGGGNDVIRGGFGNDVVSGGAGADIFQFKFGDSWFSPKLNEYVDTITDFEVGDKLAFQNFPVGQQSVSILGGSLDPNGGAAFDLVMQSLINQRMTGALGRYLVFGSNGDTYVLADTESDYTSNHVTADWMYDVTIVLKGFNSALFTADMITGL